MSFQAVLTNFTAFSAEKFVLPDKDGQENVLIVVAASFEAASRDTLRVAEEQPPIRVADEYSGDRALSSVRYEADLALMKPAADVLVHGDAHAPYGRPAGAVPVSLAVADIRKDLLVSGDRVWRRTPIGVSPSSPKPFTRMPLVYERAFGGMTADAADPRNLVGVGFRGAVSADPAIETEIPNIERPDTLVRSRSDRPEPAGFNVVSRGWRPRLDYAGTYDQNWLDHDWPLLPKDFDARHNQSAPLDQQSREVRGGEPVRLLNMTPEGQWIFRLPTLDIPVLLFFDRRQEPAALRLDTILLEPNLHRVTMTSRVAITIRRNAGLLREIAVGHASPGWVRARSQGKRFIDHAQSGGRVSPDRNYHL